MLSLIICSASSMRFFASRFPSLHVITSLTCEMRAWYFNQVLDGAGSKKILLPKRLSPALGGRMAGYQVGNPW